MQKAAVGELVMRAALSRSLLGKKQQKLLYKFLRYNEVVEGCSKAIYKGKYGIIVATSQRVIYMNKKFLTMYTAVFQYSTINRIGYSRKFFGSELHLMTNNGKRIIKCSNNRSLMNLAMCIKRNSAISQKSLENITREPLKTFGVEHKQPNVYVPRHRHGKFLPIQG